MQGFRYKSGEGFEELHDFAIAKIALYQSQLKDKELPYLLDLLDKGDEAMKEAVNHYMVQQYTGYCKYLRECMDDADKELDEISRKNGYFKDKSTQES